MKLTDGIQHLATCVVKKNENFNNDENNVKPGDNKFGIVFIITYVIVLILLLLVGKFLWNDVLCNLVSVCKKADSVWEILGLAILFSILSV